MRWLSKKGFDKFNWYEAYFCNIHVLVFVRTLLFMFNVGGLHIDM